MFGKFFKKSSGRTPSFLPSSSRQTYPSPRHGQSFHSLQPEPKSASLLGTSLKAAGAVTKKSANLLSMKQETEWVCQQVGYDPHGGLREQPCATKWGQTVASTYIQPRVTNYFQDIEDMQDALLTAPADYYLVCEGETFDEWDDFGIQERQCCFEDIMSAQVDWLRKDEENRVLHFHYGTYSPSIHRLYIALDDDQYAMFCLMDEQGYDRQYIAQAFIDQSLSDAGWVYGS